MWESEVDHFLEEDEHTHILYGVLTNKDGGGTVATEAPEEYTLAFEGGHTLGLICRCTDPATPIEEIEANPDDHPDYVGFVAYPLRGGEQIRAFGVGDVPAPGLYLDNVTKRR